MVRDEGRNTARGRGQGRRSRSLETSREDGRRWRRLQGFPSSAPELLSFGERLHQAHQFVLPRAKPLGCGRISSEGCPMGGRIRRARSPAYPPVWGGVSSTVSRRPGNGSGHGGRPMAQARTEFLSPAYARLAKRGRGPGPESRERPFHAASIARGAPWKD